jgi:peptidoglycan/xylan/chitin deacetylase (PgdA/CDA1 family)
MYHSVSDVADDPNLLCVPPGLFAEQMNWLARRGLQGVSVGTLLTAMRSGNHRRMVGITFDDGYVSVLEAALPELQRHGFGATAFIISDRLGSTNDWDEGPAWPLMQADEVRQLAAAGIEIGSHSATHMRLAGADPDRLSAEVQATRVSLGALTGTEIRGFAYPYGSMDAAAQRAVQAAGYEYACAVETSAAGIGMMAIPRVYVGRQDGASRLAVKRLLYKGHIALKGRGR